MVVGQHCKYIKYQVKLKWLIVLCELDLNLKNKFSLRKEFTKASLEVLERIFPAEEKAEE